jgi:hypothetical protein
MRAPRLGNLKPGLAPLRGFFRIEGTMSEYSIYTITNEERHFSGSCTIINCADDKEAIQAAEQWVDLHDVELWENSRFITRFHPSTLQMLD